MFYNASWKLNSSKQSIVRENLVNLMKFPPIKKAYSTVNIPNTDIVLKKDLDPIESDIDLIFFLCDVSKEGNLYYQRLKNNGLPFASCYTFDKLASDRLALEARFWSSIHMWCNHPERYKKFRKNFTIAFVIRKDDIPMEKKLKWCRILYKKLKSNELLEEHLGEMKW